MLQLTRQAGTALRSGFVCASCRALLAGGANRLLPGAVARLCAAHHYATKRKPAKSENKAGKKTGKDADTKADKTADNNPKSTSEGKAGKNTERKLEKPDATQESKSSPRRRPRKKRRRTGSGSSPSSSSSRLQLWRETLKVLKDIKADQSPSPPTTQYAAADPATSSQKSPGSAKLLGGALGMLKRVLRQELEHDAPQLAEQAASKKAAEVKEPTSLAETLASTEPPDDAKPPKSDKAAARARPKSASQPSKPLAGLAPLSAITGVGKKKRGHRAFVVNRIDANKIELTPIAKPQPPVPKLAYGLDRVLFNPGVYHVQDPRSRVFSFDPYLARIMPVKEFDFNAIKQYITSSKDAALIQTAAEQGKKYTGSTSSMTSTLAHFHYLLSAWRPINPSMMSRRFEIDSYNFTRIMRAPAATFLHRKDGTYAIDADKEFDTANILSMLGKSMEKLLTLPKEEFEKYRKTNSDRLTDEDRNGPESYHYTTLGDFLMRSQLDAYDPRLPGTGMFDLKTRAVVSIRMDARDFQKGLGYEIRNRFGQWESFEREYYDMIRSAFLKYSLQVRMGRMDGIFVAYHNTERIFGFQYIPLQEMDLSIHGQDDLTLGDREFKLSVHLLNKVLDKVTAKYPGRSLRLHFETRGDNGTPFMYIFAKPVTPTEIERIQGATRATIEEFERQMMGVAPQEARALEEEDGAEEAVDEADEHDTDEAEGDEVTSSATWEDVMLKVEDELEDEEHGMKFVREAIENALRESGLLQPTAPDETERYVDGILEALTGGGQTAASEGPATSATDNDEVARRSGAEPAAEPVEPSEGASGTGATPTAAERAAETNHEPRDDAERPSTGGPAAEEPTLKDLIVKLATQIRAIPSEKRIPAVEEEGEAKEDAPQYTLGLRKIERILSELQPQEGKKDGEVGGNKVIETGTLYVEPAEPTESEPSVPAEPTDTAGQDENKNGSPGPAISPNDFSTKGFVDEADGGELYGLVLTARNKVNGEYVVRPDNIRPKMRWVVEYAIEEINPARAKNLYAMVLKRRKNLLTPEETDRNRWYAMFQGRLDKYSKRGRNYRHREEKRGRQQPVHVLGSETAYTWESVFGDAAEDVAGDAAKPYAEWRPTEEGKKEKDE